MAGMRRAERGLHAGGIVGRFDHYFYFTFDDTDAERGLRNGRLVVPFDHYFYFPIGDTDAESWTRAM